MYSLLSFPDVTTFHCHDPLVTAKEPRMARYYQRNCTLRRTAGPSCLPNLLRSVTVSEPVLVLDDFDMTALRSAAQLFCRMSPFEDKTIV